MPEQQIPVQSKPIADDEIDLLALVKTIWNERKFIIYSLIAGAIIGILVALFSAKEYTASTVMVPQTGGDNQSRLGSLGGLAALAGINIDMSQGNEMSPLVYPQIVSSVPFQLELMNTLLNFQDYPEPITLFDYYTKCKKTSVMSLAQKYTIGLPGLLIGAIKGKQGELVLPAAVDSTNQPIILTRDQFTVKNIIDGIVSLEMNTKEGYITLTARMPEALATAQLVQKVQTLLQKYITVFKIEKAKANLRFIQGRYDEIKSEFERAQVSLALVNDRNKNFTSGLPKIEADRIQTRYTLSFSIFQEIAKQLEQAKIQVKKDTPVFAIIKPVTVPLERSKPKRSMIVFIWIFLGGVIGTAIGFSRGFIRSLKNQWDEK